MVSNLVVNTLMGQGFDVIDLGLSTTPTVEMAVMFKKAAGGIIITASHNPKEWNALKLLNSKGEFISGDEGKLILKSAEKEDFKFATVDGLGTYTKDESLLKKHIDAVVKYELVDADAVKKKNFKIVIDAINSSGAIAVPALLKALGVTEIEILNAEVNGKFAHNPEPLPDHLSELCNEVVKQKAHLGIAVDPDVDRLCFVNEDGSLFGEEYTLVAVADYVLQHTPGNTVSNLSSTKALRDITEKYGHRYEAAAVGEVNVVTKMKEINAIIGGEGNGGVIYPALHYGRDAMVGVAIMLTALAKFGNPISFLKKRYPEYTISKKKLDLPQGVNVDTLLNQLEDKYKPMKDCSRSRIDGLKIEFTDGNWIHMRKSNTEPIIRVYAESTSEVIANNLIQKINRDIYEILNASRDEN